MGIVTIGRAVHYYAGEEGPFAATIVGIRGKLDEGGGAIVDLFVLPRRHDPGGVAHDVPTQGHVRWAWPVIKPAPDAA